MLFFPFIHVKMPTNVGISTCMSTKHFMLSLARGLNSFSSHTKLYSVSFLFQINNTERITLLLDNSQKNKTVSKVNAFSNQTLIKGGASSGRFRVVVRGKKVWISFDRRSNISQINRVSLSLSLSKVVSTSNLLTNMLVR